MQPDSAFAQRFARDWIDAWNARDLDRILSHYADDFEMRSPLIEEFTSAEGDILRGHSAVRQYWQRALDRLPDLHFDLIGVYTGSESLVIAYHGPRGPAAEVFFLNDSGQVHTACAHYAPPERLPTDAPPDPSAC